MLFALVKRTLSGTVTNKKPKDPPGPTLTQDRMENDDETQQPTTVEEDLTRLDQDRHNAGAGDAKEDEEKRTATASPAVTVGAEGGFQKITLDAFEQHLCTL